MTAGKPRLVVALVLVLAWIGWAGLRPFQLAPGNGARWVDDPPGLRLDAPAMLVSSDEVAWDTTRGPAQVRLDVTLRPSPDPTPDSGDGIERDIVVLVDEAPVPALLVYQSGADLIVADRVTDRDGRRWYNDVTVPGVFEAGKDVRIHVRSDDAVTIAIDGRPREPTTGDAIAVAARGEPLRGRVLVGGHPEGRGSWTGEIAALTLGDGATTLARYDFAEAARARPTTVPNLAGPDLALEIPRRVHTLAPPLSVGSGNASDMLVNLVGFVPLGAVLALLLRRRARALVHVTASAFALSLSIELLQALTIRRTSSLEDLLCNTLGALLGAVLALRLGAWRHASSRSDPAA